MTIPLSYRPVFFIFFSIRFSTQNASDHTRGLQTCFFIFFSFFYISRVKMKVWGQQSWLTYNIVLLQSRLIMRVCELQSWLGCTHRVVYFKSHHCNSLYGASGRYTSVLSKCYFIDMEHFNTHHWNNECVHTTEIMSVNKLVKMCGVMWIASRIIKTIVLYYHFIVHALWKTTTACLVIRTHWQLFKSLHPTVDCWFPYKIRIFVRCTQTMENLVSRKIF